MQTVQSFLLIHGAWHGAWCWQGIAQPLQALGHHVMVPDLPGHGANMRPASTVTFGDYVQCLVELIKQHDKPVIVVGHSMAGLLLAQLAEIIPEHIHHLIFLAAYVPQDQQSLFSIADRSLSRGVSPFIHLDKTNREIRLCLCPEMAEVFFNRCSEEVKQKALARLQPQPLQPFTQKMQLGANFQRVAKRALICKHDRVLVPEDQWRMSKAVTDDIVYLEGDHSPYFSCPSEVIKALF